MYVRFCILVLTLTAAATASFRPRRRPRCAYARPFHPDSARVSNPDASARNQRLYDSIESKTNRRAVPRMLYKMLFVKPVLDTTMSGRVTDESRLLQPYSGKTIGEITIDRRQIFDPGGNWLRTHRQQDPPPHPRTCHPPRPAFRTGRHARSGTDRAQQTADPLTRLHRHLSTSRCCPTPSTRRASTWPSPRATAGPSRLTEDGIPKAGRWSGSPTPTSSAGATSSNS